MPGETITVLVVRCSGNLPECLDAHLGLSLGRRVQIEQYEDSFRIAFDPPIELAHVNWDLQEFPQLSVVSSE